MFERRLRAYQRAPLGGVRLGEKAGDRHRRERRIAVVRVPVGVGELDGLVHVMDVLGGVHAEGVQIDPFEDVERLEQHRPLVPRPRLVHVEAMKVRRRGLLDLAVERGEVLIGEHTAGGFVGIGDPPRDVALVEGIAAGANRGDAVVRARERRLVRGRDRTERAREVGLAKQFADLRNLTVRVVRLRRPLVLLAGLALADEEVAQERVHREAVGQLDRRLQHLFEAHRALGFERERHGVQHRGNGGAERTVSGDRSALGEHRGRRRLGRGALAVDDDNLTRLRVVDHRRRFAAESEMRNLADRCGEHRGNARVHRVPALLEYANTRGDGIVTSGGDDPAGAEDFGPQRIDAPDRSRCRRLRAAVRPVQSRDGRDREACRPNLQSAV